MIDKRVLPESFDFGMPSVDIIDSGRSGLDKTAMVKRAGVFDDVLADLKPRKDRTYLHVITTGAMEKYGANLNRDAFNETACDHTCPYPEEGAKKTVKLAGGLKAYHDRSYMSKEAGVYQEHHSSEEPSGEIVASRYNGLMKRGELIIAVDTDKWAKRLEKKASGQNIYLSMGCRVDTDLCSVCHHRAHTMSEHCDHFKKLGRAIMDDGTQSCVINDAPEFYDISGVDVPADKIAFVLNKVASGAMPKQASADARYLFGVRAPMPLTKSAAVLMKMAKLEKRVESFIESGKSHIDEEAFQDPGDAGRTLVIKIRMAGHPADEVIDGCNRKGILLSPGTLFSLLGSECGDPEGRACLEDCDDDCCGDCSAMLRELADDAECRNGELLDGCFDQHFPVDLGLDRLLEEFVPDLGMTNPAVNSRVIRITIVGRPKRGRKQEKKAAFAKRAEDALRRTYARYFLSFAAANDEPTCMNALRTIAGYGG